MLTVSKNKKLLNIDDKKKLEFSKKSTRNNLRKKSFVENLYPNLTCLNSSNFNNVRIDDIRSLKEKILTSSLNDNKTS